MEEWENLIYALKHSCEPLLPSFHYSIIPIMLVILVNPAGYMVTPMLKVRRASGLS